jgi:hypothetical protein
MPPYAMISSLRLKCEVLVAYIQNSIQSKKLSRLASRFSLQAHSSFSFRAQIQHPQHQLLHTLSGNKNAEDKEQKIFFANTDANSKKKKKKKKKTISV